MSRREDIDNSIWSDEDFLALSGPAKLLYVWSFTNSRCGMAGLYRVARPLMAIETGFDGADLDQALAELHAGRFCSYEQGVMWVRSRIKHLRTKSPSIAKSIRSDIEKLDGHPLAAALRDEYAATEWVWVESTRGSRDPIETPSTPPEGSPEGTQGTGKGKGSSKGSSTSNGGRAKPTPPPADELPADLPEALKSIAEEVHARLHRLAVHKGANDVTLARAGALIRDYPDHDHRRLASDFEDYWTHGGGATRPQKDVVAAYRNRVNQFAAQPKSAGHLRAVPPAGQVVSSQAFLAGLQPKEAS